MKKFCLNTQKVKRNGIQCRSALSRTRQNSFKMKKINSILFDLCGSLAYSTTNRAESI